MWTANRAPLLRSALCAGIKCVALQTTVSEKRLITLGCLGPRSAWVGLDRKWKLRERVLQENKYGAFIWNFFVHFFEVSRKFYRVFFCCQRAAVCFCPLYAVQLAWTSLTPVTGSRPGPSGWLARPAGPPLRLVCRISTGSEPQRDRSLQSGSACNGS